MMDEFIKKESEIIQTFPELCSCSGLQKDKMRNFILYRQNYLFELGLIKYRFFDSIKIECSNCHWSASLPLIFAKKVFKHGLRASTLIRYSQDRILSSRFLNLFGSLWKVWLISLAVLMILVFVKFYYEPVVISEPETVPIEELQNSKFVGQVVRVKGKVDYSLALTKDDLLEDGKNGLKIVSREVYMPIFSEKDSTKFVVLRGGNSDVNIVLGRSGITDSSILKNQDYFALGKVESIEAINNTDLKNFFTIELPRSKSAEPAKLVINSVGVIGIYDFMLKFFNYFMFILMMLFVSIYIQIYIDRKIFDK